MKKIFFYSFLIILFMVFSGGDMVYAQNDMDPLKDGFDNTDANMYEYDNTSTTYNNQDITNDDETGYEYDSSAATFNNQDIVEDDEDSIQYYNENVVEDNEYEYDYDYNTGSSSSYHGLPSTTLSSVLSGILNWLLGILGTLALISFVISGVMYFFAIGDENQVTKAKTMTLYSIIGIIVALSGFIIIKAINSLLQGGTMF